MKIICLTVGKKHDPNLASAIEEYEKRLSAYVDFSFAYIPSSNVDKESAAIERYIDGSDTVVLLDECGTPINNEKFMKNLEQWQLGSVKRLVIIIGGAYGVNAAVQQRSNQVYSLSELVFPHQIVRLLVVEQLYRSFNMLAGGKYHHS